MKKYVYLSAVCTLAINLSATDLGTIQVESSTIDDKFDTKKTEVSSTSTMKTQGVEAFHAENIADVLNTLPGVTVRKNEGDSNKIHIRGIATEVYMGEKPGVAIVIDGVPVQERAGSVNIDIDNIESIKVIKGGASYLYGNDALAGAVIITTKKAKSKNEGSALTEYGSNGYSRSVASYNVGTENFAARVQASYKKSDGYWEDSDYWAKSVNGKFQYYIDDTSDITFGADKTLRYENDSGSITYATFDGTTYTDNVETNPTSVGETGYATDYDIDLTKLFLTYSKDFDNGSNLMAQIYQYDDTTKNQSAAYDSNSDGVKDDHLYESYAQTIQRGLKSEYRMDGTTAAGMLGLDLARNKTDQNSKYRVEYSAYNYHTHSMETHPVGEVKSDTSSDEDINAVYGELKYGFTKELTVTLNGRYDNIKYNYTNNLNSDTWKKSFNEASYRAGATYAIDPKFTLFTSVSTGFRVPQLSEIYAGDLASYGSYENNLNIDPEKTYNYEIGLRQALNGFFYEASIFELRRNGAITRNGGNYVTSQTVATSYGNYADIRNRGLELALNSNKKKELYFVFNYTYLDSQYTKFDEYQLVVTDTASGDSILEGTYDLAGHSVPRTSKHTFYFELDYKATPKVLLTADFNYRSSQYADDMNRVKVNGYGIMNLRAKYNTKLAGIDFEMFGKVENFFDKQYYMMPRVTGDRNDDGLYDYRDMGMTVNPGRTYLAGISAKF